MNTAVKSSMLVVFSIVLLSAGDAALGQLLFTVAPGGPSGLAPEIVYGAPGLVPTAAGPGSGLVPGDAIDGFSLDKNVTQFLLCFSVDGASVGGPTAVAAFPPFNVTNQAARRQAAGDAFISTEAYDRTGNLGAPPGMGLFNNVLAINQSPSYADDFGLLPLADPALPVPLGTPLDDVVGGGGPPASMGLTDLFFTLDAASTSLFAGAAPYPGGTGADVFFDPTPDIFVGAPTPGDEFKYASAATLGLTTSDEIDALVVFDSGPAGTATTWGSGDQILFSLAPGSPSLGLLGFSPADVLSVTFGGAPSLFAPHTDIGLAATDNVDMLELVPLLGTAEQTIADKIVPEPTSALLLLLAGLAAAKSRLR